MKEISLIIMNIYFNSLVMKRLLTATVLAILLYPSFLSFDAVAQEKDTLLIKQKTLDLVGIWKLDLPEQKEKLEPEDFSKVNGMPADEQEKLWIEADSRVYVFEASGKFQISSVVDGSFQESWGKWSLDPKEMILQLESEIGISRYKVIQSPKKMMLMPMERSEKDFNKLYLRSLLR